MLWHGFVCDPRQDHRQGSAVLRLKPSESFFSVFILGINPTPCGRWQKAAKRAFSAILHYLKICGIISL